MQNHSIFGFVLNPDRKKGMAGKPVRLKFRNAFPGLRVGAWALLVLRWHAGLAFGIGIGIGIGIQYTTSTLRCLVSLSFVPFFFFKPGSNPKQVKKHENTNAMYIFYN